MFWMILGPTAVGKTTLANSLFAKGYPIVVSYTTRPRRRGEVAGKDYWFVSEQDFMQLVEKGWFAEHTKYGQYYYGVSKQSIESAVKRKGIAVGIVDGYGFIKLKQQYDYRAVFMLPPSKLELSRRMKERGDSQDFIADRLQNLEWELEFAQLTNYVLAPDTPENLTTIMSYLMDSLQRANSQRV